MDANTSSLHCYSYIHYLKVTNSELFLKFSPFFLEAMQKMNVNICTNYLG